ncbi:MAG: alpha/beta hydrolase [Myxococcota bacterium]
MTTVEVGPRGLRLALCEWPGRADAVPVVIVHGFLEQGAAWDAVATALDRRVYAPDQRGHGRSDHVGPGGWYHFWDYVADLDAVVGAIGGPVDLIGHSMGGTVSALYAGARPEQVRRLVLVEGLGPPDATGDTVRRAREFLRDRREPPAHRPLADLDDAAARLRRSNPALAPAEALRLAARASGPVGDGWGWTWDPLHRGRAPNPFSAAQFREFLREIRAPVLAIDGGASAFRVPDHDERLAALQSVEHDQIPGAGHLVHHDDPIGLARRVRAFLDRP